MSRKPTISNKVWRQGWRQEAAAMQAASAELAACLDWLEQKGYDDSAMTMREIAMELGVRETLPALRCGFRSISEKRP
jgi:hypothetical protein